MSSGNETFRFDVDGEPLFLALQRTQAKLKDISKEYVNVARSTKLSSEQMIAEQTKLISMFVKEEQTYERLIAQRKRMAIETTATNAVVTKSTNAAAGAMGKYGMMIGQVSFAVDDFVTVAQLQNWSLDGVITGLRSAANNFGMVLYAIHPLLAIVPSLATAIGGPLLKALFGSSESTKDLAANAERAQKALEDLSKKAEEIRSGKTAVQEVEMKAKAREAVLAAGVEVKKAEDALLALGPAMAVDEVGNIIEDTPQQALDRQLKTDILAEKKAAQKKAVADEKLVIEDFQARTAVDKIRTELEGAAADFAKRGIGQEEIFQALQGNFGEALPYTGSSQKLLQEIAGSAVSNAISSPAEEETKNQRLLRLARNKEKAISDAHQDAINATPHLKLPKATEESFKKQEAEAAKAVRDLERTTNDGNEKLIQEFQKQGDRLERWIDAVSKRIGFGPVPGANGNNMPPG